MDKITKLAINYFQTQKGTFWRWGEGGEVIEFNDDFGDSVTICYRKELIEILEEISVDGIPPLASVLLMMAAIHDKLGEIYLNLLSDGLENIVERVYFSAEITYDESKKILDLEKKMKDCYGVISSVDASLKQGKNKTHFIQEVFRNSYPKIPAKESKEIIQLFNSGILDEKVFREGDAITYPRLKLEMGCLVQAISPFKDAETLELKLKTSLEKIPEALEIELPEKDDLIQQLSQDEKTYGIANLTKRLIAGLNIPMHTAGTSNQALGGISDITNRGAFDKLLLSELANDNETLTARLVNNEALYYQQEEPPSNKNMERHIYLDATLKMWGLPRVFALSSALACTINKKGNIRINAYHLLGKNKEEIDLNSKDGVIDALSVLDSHLDCCTSLLYILNGIKNNQESEYFLVTHEETLNHPSYIANLLDIQSKLSYLIIVHRTGELNFYQFKNGRRKLISTTRYDLEELLKGKKKKRQPKKINHLPAYFSEPKAPLYFPTIDMKFNMASYGQRNYQEFRFAGKYYLLGITEGLRVLCWTNKKTGAIELIPYVKSGQYYFGYDDEGNIFILVKEWGGGLLHLYTTNIHSEEHDLYEIPVSGEKISDIIFKDNFFHIHALETYYSIDCRDGSLVDCQLEEKNYVRPTLPPSSSYGQLKRLVNPGYNTFKRIEEVFINADGLLNIGNKTLFFGRTIFFKTTWGTVRTIMTNKGWEEIVSVDVNPYVKLRKFTFSEGSEVYVDVRGLVHLVSANEKIAEVTLTFIENKPVGAWASDGMLCGSEYFSQNKTDIAHFHNRYIAPFINHIIHNQ